MYKNQLENNFVVGEDSEIIKKKRAEHESYEKLSRDLNEKFKKVFTTKALEKIGGLSNKNLESIVGNTKSQVTVLSAIDKKLAELVKLQRKAKDYSAYEKEIKRSIKEKTVAQLKKSKANSSYYTDDRRKDIVKASENFSELNDNLKQFTKVLKKMEDTQNSAMDLIAQHFIKAPTLYEQMSVFFNNKFLKNPKLRKLWNFTSTVGGWFADLADEIVEPISDAFSNLIDAAMPWNLFSLSKKGLWTREVAVQNGMPFQSIISILSGIHKNVWLLNHKTLPELENNFTGKKGKKIEVEKRVGGLGKLFELLESVKGGRAMVGGAAMLKMFSMMGLTFGTGLAGIPMALAGLAGVKGLGTNLYDKISRRREEQKILDDEKNTKDKRKEYFTLNPAAKQAFDEQLIKVETMAMKRFMKNDGLSRMIRSFWDKGALMKEDREEREAEEKKIVDSFQGAVAKKLNERGSIWAEGLGEFFTDIVYELPEFAEQTVDLLSGSVRNTIFQRMMEVFKTGKNTLLDNIYHIKSNLDTIKSDLSTWSQSLSNLLTPRITIDTTNIVSNLKAALDPAIVDIKDSITKAITDSLTSNVSNVYQMPYVIAEAVKAASSGFTNEFIGNINDNLIAFKDAGIDPGVEGIKVRIINSVNSQLTEKTKEPVASIKTEPEVSPELKTAEIHVRGFKRKIEEQEKLISQLPDKPESREYAIKELDRLKKRLAEAEDKLSKLSNQSSFTMKGKPFDLQLFAEDKKNFEIPDQLLMYAAMINAGHDDQIAKMSKYLGTGTGDENPFDISIQLLNKIVDRLEPVSDAYTPTNARERRRMRLARSGQVTVDNPKDFIPKRDWLGEIMGLFGGGGMGLKLLLGGAIAFGANYFLKNLPLDLLKNIISNLWNGKGIKDTIVDSIKDAVIKFKEKTFDNPNMTPEDQKDHGSDLSWKGVKMGIQKATEWGVGKAWNLTKWTADKATAPFRWAGGHVWDGLKWAGRGIKDVAKEPATKFLGWAADKIGYDGIKESFKNRLGSMGTGIKDAYTGAKTGLGKTASIITGEIQNRYWNAKDTIKGALNRGKDYLFNSRGANAMKILTGEIQNRYWNAKDILKNYGTKVKDNYNTFKNMLGSTEIGNTLINTKDKIIGKVGQAWNGVKGFKNAAVGKVGQAWDGVTGAFKTGKDFLLNNRFVNAMGSTKDAIVNSKAGKVVAEKSGQFFNWMGNTRIGQGLTKSRALLQAGGAKGMAKTLLKSIPTIGMLFALPEIYEHAGRTKENWKKWREGKGSINDVIHDAARSGSMLLGGLTLGGTGVSLGNMATDVAHYGLKGVSNDAQIWADGDIEGDNEAYLNSEVVTMSDTKRMTILFGINPRDLYGFPKGKLAELRAVFRQIMRFPVKERAAELAKVINKVRDFVANNKRGSTQKLPNDKEVSPTVVSQVKEKASGLWDTLTSGSLTLSSIFGSSASNTKPSIQSLPVAPISAPSPATKLTVTKPSVGPYDSEGRFKEGDQNNFLLTLLPHAQRVSQMTGVPVEAILTHAVHETGWGKKTAGAFNYFGMKAHGKRWKGKTRKVNTWEEYGGKKHNIIDEFRAYDSVGQGLDGYQDFLKTNPRYKQALKAQSTYEYFNELKKAGYATDSKYVDKTVGLSNSVVDRLEKLKQKGLIIAEENVSKETIDKAKEIKDTIVQKTNELQVKAGSLAGSLPSVDNILDMANKGFNEAKVYMDSPEFKKNYDDIKSKMTVENIKNEAVIQAENIKTKASDLMAKIPSADNIIGMANKSLEDLNNWYNTSSYKQDIDNLTKNFSFEKIKAGATTQLNNIKGNLIGLYQSLPNTEQVIANVNAALRSMGYTDDQIAAIKLKATNFGEGAISGYTSAKDMVTKKMQEYQAAFDGQSNSVDPKSMTPGVERLIGKSYMSYDPGAYNSNLMSYVNDKKEQAKKIVKDQYANISNIANAGVEALNLEHGVRVEELGTKIYEVVSKIGKVVEEYEKDKKGPSEQPIINVQGGNTKVSVISTHAGNTLSSTLINGGAGGLGGGSFSPGSSLK